jgi:hypothetical protein
MPDDPTPFTEQDLATLNKQLEQLDVADRLIQRTSRAGIDVTTLAATSRETREQLMRLKAAFFPGS